MADEVKPRPVFGEIMTAAPAARKGVADGTDVVDAEFETLADARDFPRLPGSVAAERTVKPVAGMDVLKRAPVAPVAASRAGPLFWAFGLALVACAFWVSGGHALMRSEHQQAVDVVAPTIMLRIVDVRSKVTGSAGKPVLEVDGAAVNEGTQPAVLPGIEIKVTGANGRATRYKLGTSDRPLPAGERFVFSSRLEVPKDGVKSVAVSFREDVDAGGAGQGH